MEVKLSEKIAPAKNNIANEYQELFFFRNEKEEGGGGCLQKKTFNMSEYTQSRETPHRYTVILGLWENIPGKNVSSWFPFIQKIQEP